VYQQIEAVGKIKGKGVIFLTGHNLNNLSHQEAWN
jgi:hypothetical protein